MNVNGKRTRPNPSNLRASRQRLTNEPPYNQPALKLVIRDPNAFSRAATRGVLTREFKGDQVVGNGTDADILRRAGVEHADGFVAVTEGDNRNIMASQIAKNIFKVPHVVARIYDPERAEAYEKIGLHTICPTLEGARHIEKVLLERESR